MSNKKIEWGKDNWVDDIKEEYHDLDSSVVELKEQKAWYHFSLIAEGYSCNPDSYYHTTGIVYAYMASSIVIALGVGVSLLVGKYTGMVYGLQAGVAFASLWFMAGMYWVFKDFKPRPGPPLPDGINVVTFSVGRLSKVIYNASKLKKPFLVPSWMVFVFRWAIVG
ncbi:hypothetical protein HDU76_013314 [Blyttiomyces sp. JEL0837]|nr:hypothetical protein HDU76_013314 [Blyttiomyces sp. JEL0837]